MREELRSIRCQKSDLRKFGISVGLVLSLIAVVLFFIGKPSFQFFIYTGLALILSGILTPSVLKPLYWPWMIFATILGWIMTRVILGTLYYLVITPIGLMVRVFGLLSINVKWQTDKESYWNKKEEKERNKKTYEKQF